MKWLTWVLGMVMLLTVSLAVAEWDGVPEDGYWWPYMVYLQIIWIGLPAYIFIGWLWRRWQDRKAIRDITARHRTGKGE